MPKETTSVVFKKEAVAKQMVWAEVYAPNRPDADMEYMRADEIEKMAYGFMKAKKMDCIDEGHSQIHLEGCHVIESFIARKGDPDFIEGAWVVGMHIDNAEIWDKVLKGEINGFSMEAWVTRVEQEVDIEIPSVCAGRTMKSDGEDGDHEHEFLVSYGEEGNFKGGRTDTVNGHFHIIKRGTATEVAAGHSHRFSHVEGIDIK